LGRDADTLSSAVKKESDVIKIHTSFD